MEMDNEAYMKYLGLAALLGRLIRPRDQDFLFTSPPT